MSIKLIPGYAIPQENEGQYNGLGAMAFRAFYGESASDASLVNDPRAGRLSPTFSPLIELGDEPLKKWSAFYGYDGYRGVSYGPNSPQYGALRMTGGDVRGYACPNGMGCGNGLGQAEDCPSRATWFVAGVAAVLLWPLTSRLLGAGTSAAERAATRL